MTSHMPTVNQPQLNTYNGPSGGYVLVVDDSEPELELLSSVLTEAGYEVKVAASGPTALDIIHTTAIEIVLLDINMPEMDGYSVCEKLKENEATADIPVIFISGYDGTIDKIKAFSIGAEDYIAKPFSIQEVVARVGNHISHRRMRRELQQTNEILERRVAERTEELSRVVEDLKDQVFEREQAEAALQQHTDRLRVLHQIDRGIMAAQSLQEIGQAALDPIFSLFACQFASLTLFDFGLSTATLLASTGTDGFQVQPGTTTALADFDDIELLRQGQPIVEDVRSSPNWSAMDRKLMAAEVRTRILAPLISRDELIGCLTLGSREPGSLSAEHAVIAAEIASQLALALDNAQLHAETQGQAKTLNALHKAAEAMASTLELDTVLKQIMSELRAIMGAEGASILLRDAATNDLVFATVVSQEAHDLLGMRLP
ncbi:MAG: response regulator, partial [Anaerolineae bacterium]|nr:response regulator [Anaerolineae bacterium]